MLIVLMLMVAGDDWTSLDKARAQIAKFEAPMLVVLSIEGDSATETIKADIAREFRGVRVFIDVEKSAKEARHFNVLSAANTPEIVIVYPATKGEWKTQSYRNLLTSKPVLKFLRDNKLTKRTP